MGSLTMFKGAMNTSTSDCPDPRKFQLEAKLDQESFIAQRAYNISASIYTSEHSSQHATALKKSCVLAQWLTLFSSCSSCVWSVNVEIYVGAECVGILYKTAELSIGLVHSLSLDINIRSSCDLEVPLLTYLCLSASAYIDGIHCQSMQKPQITAYSLKVLLWFQPCTHDQGFDGDNHGPQPHLPQRWSLLWCFEIQEWSCMMEESQGCA
ncbi:uncharacterized protein ARMOST_10441 [Armillaria ostoyae]|uniref:Uncharacterized protein n=1 Tax=Armillaria ostoyae TaxID=47428 RepID=A0A284REE5_ARMOS|nr:uncharacterized protein ARMOST_10441 [Armillaria ostoyae]